MVAAAEVRSLVEETGSLTEAGKRLGISRHAVRRTLLTGRSPKPGAQTIIRRPRAVQWDTLPDDDISVEEILAQKEKHYGLKLARVKAEHYMQIKVPESKPFGLLVLGDPHLDDDGSDTKSIREHLKIGRQPGVYTTQVGDITNNWIGSLLRLYANQNTSFARSVKLINWLYNETGQDWLWTNLGNHDGWGNGKTIHKLIVGSAAKWPVLDWDSRVKLVNEKGFSWKIHMAHNFPGHSMWHNMHAMLRAARFSTDADLLIAGHLHIPGTMYLPLPGLGRYVHCLRVAGYKKIDDHAVTLGYPMDISGSSCLVICVPTASDPANRFLFFYDIEMGYQVLRSMRGLR